jgi:hypothetical protein
MKRVFLLLIFLFPFCLLSQSTETRRSALSDEVIQKQLSIIEETKDLLKDYNSYKDAKSQEDIERIKIRQEAFSLLIQSSYSSKALMNYYLKEVKEGHINPHLYEVSDKLAERLKQDLAEYMHKEIAAPPDDSLIRISFSPEELHSYLLSITSYPVSNEILNDSNNTIAKLPLKVKENFSDVWLSWLRSVHLESLFQPPRDSYSPNMDTMLFLCSYHLLKTLNNHEGIDIALKLLQRATGYKNSEVWEYVYKLGENSALPYMMWGAEKDNHTNMLPLYIADEKGAKAFYDAQFLRRTNLNPKAEAVSCFQLNSTMGAHYGSVRPDLARGLIRYYLQDQEALKNHWSSWIIHYGSSALSEQEIIEQIRLSEKGEDKKTLAIWIDILGRRDSVAGNDILLELLEKEDFSKKYLPDVSHAVCKAIFRRILGRRGSELQKVIEELPAERRGKVVQGLLGSSGIFPDFYNGPGLMCGDGMDSDFQKAEPNPSKNESLLIQYQDNLLQWIDWTSEPDRLAHAYAIMTSQEAQKRFLDILNKGNEFAIKLVWTRSMDISPDILRKLLKEKELKDESRMFLCLRLSELSDKEAYDLLTNVLFSKLENEKKFPQRFYTPMLDEITSLNDDENLIKLIKLLKESNLSESPFPRELLPTATHDGRPLSSIIAPLGRLVRINPKKANNFLKDFDASNLEDQIFLLNVAIVASCSNAEVVLKKIQPFAAGWDSLSSKDLESTKVKSLWSYSLRLTGTAWCRDQLVMAGAWHDLALLGDRRVLSSKKANYTDIFLLGDFKKAIDCGLEIRKNYFPTTVINPYLAGIPDEKTFSGDLRKDLFNKFMNIYPTLNDKEKAIALSFLPEQRVIWSNEICLMLLRDSYAPARLTALVRILEYPRPGLENEVKFIEQNDPFPWCRRVAHEILIFEPDPLDPEQGIAFALP